MLTTVMWLLSILAWLVLGTVLAGILAWISATIIVVGVGAVIAIVSMLFGR